MTRLTQRRPGGVVDVFRVALFFFLPNFWIAFDVLFLVFAIEIGVYLGIRNSKVGLADLKTSLKASFTSKKATRKQPSSATSLPPTTFHQMPLIA